MSHTCPKCKKKWKCITDDLFEELLGVIDGCDMTEDNICYKCAGVTGMEDIRNKLKVGILRRKINGELKIIEG